MTRINPYKRILCHLTDIEGNLSYLQRWAQDSEHIQFTDGRLQFRSAHPNCHFVFGGDYCDRGPADIFIGRALVAFKKEHPEQVTLIAGNRDIKCRRFSYELDPKLIRERLLFGEAAWWNPHVPPRTYLIRHMQEAGLPTKHEKNLRAYVDKLNLGTCQSIYLHWMFNENMGCRSAHHKPSTFEYRRLELANSTGLAVNAISDEAVVASYIDSVKAGGVTTEYLQHANLAKVIGETLFLHGAVTPENMGYVPDLKEPIEDAKAWISALNDWYHAQIHAWLASPTEDSLQPPGQKALEKYVVHNPKSVVTSNWYQEGQCKPIPLAVQQYLTRAGIYRVIGGHQPFSDFPLIIREGDLEVIVGDTSYSDTTAPEDNRGKALHHLTVLEAGKESYASIKAIRATGESMSLQLPSRAEKNRGIDTMVGHFSARGGIIRPKSSSALTISQLNGLSVVDLI